MRWRLVYFKLFMHEEFAFYYRAILLATSKKAHISIILFPVLFCRALPGRSLRLANFSNSASWAGLRIYCN